MIDKDELAGLSSREAQERAQAIFDDCEGDLTDERAEDFRALVDHAREAQRVETRERGFDLVRRVARGEAVTDRGSLDVDRDEGRPPRERDTALRVLERSVSEGTLSADRAAAVERLVEVGAPASRSWCVRWAAAADDPAYVSAFAKLLRDPTYGHHTFDAREQEAVRTAAAVQHERAMSTTDASGGFLIPMQLDPSILLSSNGSTNPLRLMARVVQCTGDVWYGVSSEGVTAHWYAEAAEVSDDTPSLLGPQVPNYRGSAWVPFSIEIEGDGAQFAAEVGRLLADSIEQLQATAFVTGSGSGEPTGFITALTGGSSEIPGGATLTADDAYELQNDLVPRFQANSAFAANLTSINTLRQAETTAGALKFPALQDDPPMLCIVIDRGAVRKRSKKPSKPYRDKFGHTPLSADEEIPWGGPRLIIGTGAHGSLPITPEVMQEAARRHIDLVAVPTEQACRLISGLKPREVRAVLHVTC